jgi:hypothetical protein
MSNKKLLGDEMNIQDLNSLKRWFSDQISNIDVSNYRFGFDSLVEFGTENLLMFLKRQTNFKWGEDVDKYLDNPRPINIFDFISDYELEN